MLTHPPRVPEPELASKAKEPPRIIGTAEAHDRQKGGHTDWHLNNPKIARAKVADLGPLGPLSGSGAPDCIVGEFHA